MSTTAVPSPPTARTVVVEQLRTVGLAVRREIAVIGAGLLLLVLTMGVVALSPDLQVQIDADMGLHLNPEDLGYLAAMVAVLAPLAIWKGETPWGDTQLWSLPVDRPRHALAKVGAGWVWLMGLVAAGLLALCAAALLSGGGPGIETTRLLVVDAVAAEAGGAAGTAAVAWTTPWWQWLIPFTAATTVYLFATALWIGTPHPWLWLGGIYLVGLVVGGVLELTDIAPLESGANVLLASLDQLLSGGMETLSRYSYEPAVERGIRAWWTLPSFGRWSVPTTGWLVAGVTGVVLAARRHREG